MSNRFKKTSLQRKGGGEKENKIYVGSMYGIRERASLKDKKTTTIKTRTLLPKQKKKKLNENNKIKTKTE